MTGKRMTGAALAVLLAAACSDQLTGPAPVTASLNRFTSVLDDSVVVQLDSLPLSLPLGTRWLLTHSARAWWIALVDFKGTGGTAASSVARWRRDPTTLNPGTYVDTLTITRNDGGATVVFLDSLVIRATIAPYITVRRAWRPGERDSAVAAIVAHNLWGGIPGVAGFSELADEVLPLDSTVDIVANPLYQAAAPRGPYLVMSPVATGMTMVGMDLFVVDSSVVPLDTTNAWLMNFWYNTTTPTYKGYTVEYSVSATIGPQQLNNTSWDASAGTLGGGGGEINPSTGEYWEVTSGTMQVTSNTARTGTGSLITSGPFTGGIQRSGTMGGWQHNIAMSRLLPTTGATQKWTLDFRSAPIPAARVECVWYGPPPALQVNEVCNP